MNILLLGSGGREHALAWKLAQSPKLTKLYIAPGNAGTSSCGINIDMSVGDFEAIAEFVKERDIQMIVVGPEAPLVDGLTDFFLENEELKNIIVIGPSKAGAMLEGSKAYAKQFMKNNNIPTAAYAYFERSSMDTGLMFIEAQTPPIVLKADGLAAGKGVLICKTVEEAKEEFKNMLEGKFGDASTKVVIEQFLSGSEFSVFALTDGTTYKLLPTAKDYKKVGEGDTGLNTGGMGAISPVPFVEAVLMQKVEDQIVKPTIEGLLKENINYKGFIYFGLINVNGDPFVIEYNVRLGDPETEVVLPRLRSDLLELFQAVDDGSLSDKEIVINKQVATTVVLTSGGYPGSYEKGKAIRGLEYIDDSIVFHAGTIEEEGKILTSGGRVLTVTTLADDLNQALQISNKNAGIIEFENKYYRKDIGFDLQ